VIRAPLSRVTEALDSRLELITPAPGLYQNKLLQNQSGRKILRASFWGCRGEVVSRRQKQFGNGVNSGRRRRRRRGSQQSCGAQSPPVPDIFGLDCVTLISLLIFKPEGADLLKLTREDVIQICGPADGIRLFNALKGR